MIDKHHNNEGTEATDTPNIKINLFGKASIGTSEDDGDNTQKISFFGKGTKGIKGGKEDKGGKGGNDDESNGILMMDNHNEGNGKTVKRKKGKGKDDITATEADYSHIQELSTPLYDEVSIMDNIVSNMNENIEIQDEDETKKVKRRKGNYPAGSTEVQSVNEDKILCDMNGCHHEDDHYESSKSSKSYHKRRRGHKSSKSSSSSDDGCDNNDDCYHHTAYPTPYPTHSPQHYPTHSPYHYPHGCPPDDDGCYPSSSSKSSKGKGGGSKSKKSGSGKGKGKGGGKGPPSSGKSSKGPHSPPSSKPTMMPNPTPSTPPPYPTPSPGPGPGPSPTFIPTITWK